MAQQILNQIMQILKISESDVGGSVKVIGNDPIVDSPFKVGEACASVLAAQGAAIATIWKMRTGRGQDVSVEVPSAINALHCVDYLHQNGYPIEMTVIREPISAYYQTLDNRWVFINGPYPHLRDGLLDLLRCANNRKAIVNAISKWEAQGLEDAIAEKNLCGTILRTQNQWLSHPQGIALSELPVVCIEKIADSEPEPFSPAKRPLSDVRILEATHVLAGPIGARTLAEQGADVLHIRGPKLPFILPIAMDTGYGKLSAFLDLEQSEDIVQMKKLASEADVFVNGYRPGTLQRRGFSPQAIARLRPGIIYASLSCYGEVGPWQYRAGWEQLAQTCTGIAAEQGSIDAPQLVPVFYLNDYLTGYLLAAGILSAMIRRAHEGGSYHVKVSLCQTSMWVQKLGRIDKKELSPFATLKPVPKPTLIQSQTPYGELQHMGPVAQYSETKPYWERPTVPIGSSLARWPERKNK